MEKQKERKKKKKEKRKVRREAEVLRSLIQSAFVVELVSAFFN